MSARRTSLGTPAVMGTGPIEPIPAAFAKFAKGARLVRVVQKMCRDFQQCRVRLLIVMNYGLYVCHRGVKGEVNRFLIFALVTQLKFFDRYVRVRCTGQADLILHFHPCSENSRNDMAPVCALLDELCRAANPSAGRVVATSLAQLGDDAVLTVPLSHMKEALAAAGESGSATTETLDAALLGNVTGQSAKKDQVLRSVAALRRSIVVRHNYRLEELRGDLIRRRVMELVEDNDPKEASNVALWLDAYRGREEALVATLEEKYGRRRRRQARRLMHMQRGANAPATGVTRHHSLSFGPIVASSCYGDGGGGDDDSAGSDSVHSSEESVEISIEPPASLDDDDDDVGQRQRQGSWWRPSPCKYS